MNIDKLPIALIIVVHSGKNNKDLETRRRGFARRYSPCPLLKFPQQYNYALLFKCKFISTNYSPQDLSSKLLIFGFIRY